MVDDDEEVEPEEAEGAVLMADDAVTAPCCCEVFPFAVTVLDNVGVLDNALVEEALPDNPPPLDCTDDVWEREDCPCWFNEAMADLNFVVIGCRDGENVVDFSNTPELVAAAIIAFLLLSKLSFWIISSSFRCSSYM